VVDIVAAFGRSSPGCSDHDISASGGGEGVAKEGVNVEAIRLNDILAISTCLPFSLFEAFTRSAKLLKVRVPEVASSRSSNSVGVAVEKSSVSCSCSYV
jgi:hypothetical protein